MPQAILTIKILDTDETRTETFDHEMSGVAIMQAQARSQQIHSQGYPLNNEDDSQSWHPCVTTIAEA